MILSFPSPLFIIVVQKIFGGGGGFWKCCSIGDGQVLKKLPIRSQKVFTEVGNFFLRGGVEGSLQALHKHLYPLSY